MSPVNVRLGLDKLSDGMRLYLVLKLCAAVYFSIRYVVYI